VQKLYLGNLKAGNHEIVAFFTGKGPHDRDYRRGTTLKVDDKEVANYLYTDREVQALHRGGVQKLYLGNLKAGSHEIVAFFTGKGPHERDYRRGTTLKVDKTVGAKYVELRISDREASLQPEFVVRQWE
jgi:hypothetical protein